MYHFYFYKNLLWEIVSDGFGPNWDCRKESLDMYHFYFNKNLLWEIVSDAFGPNWDCTLGKNCFLPLSWIFLLHMNNFGKNLLWEIVSDAFGPNLVCWKESSPTFIIQNKSFFYIYKYLLKEVKSRWFGKELSQVGKNCFFLFPVRMEIICRNRYSTRERNGA